MALSIEWIDVTPDNGILITDFILAAHDGSLHFHDVGQAVPDELREPFGLLSSAGARVSAGAFAIAFENAIVTGMHNYPYRTISIGVPPPGHLRSRRAHLVVDPAQHRYLSYLATIKPSDDAFIGNDDPMQIELFDANGRFRGPLVINLIGSQVIDAGLCGNDETDLRLLDGLTSSVCSNGEGIVRPHPGLNGSIRNPDATPQRVLGGRFAVHGQVINYGASAADFTVPGYRLGRLLVTRAGARWHMAGSWYNPERAGEGVNLEVIGPASASGPPRILVHWYTFEPDSSGEQVWLTGMGDLGGNQARVPLHRTEGGRFASTDNPDLVERTPWGHVDLSFTSCSLGTIQFTPLDATWPEGGYAIHRLGPLPQGADPLCQP